MPRSITSPRRSLRTLTGRLAGEVRSRVGAEIRRQRNDAGLSIRRLAEQADIAPAHLSQIERGLREPSISVLAAIATALGGDLRVRIYPGTGPRIRDRIQTAIGEALLAQLHPRWRSASEVPVYRPVRGVIDAVLDDAIIPPSIVVATEIQSELRRLEQLLRWSHEKADALPSSTWWHRTVDAAAPPRIDRLLVVRSTAANRRIVATATETLRHEFPARTADAVAALTTADAPWPGSALIWASMEHGIATILDGPPRGVRVGR